MARTHQQKKSNQDMVLAKAKKRPWCPDFAKLRYITNEQICHCQIGGGDSGWHKELMLRTWEGDYYTYKDVVTANWTAVDNGQHDTVGDLAHAASHTEAVLIDIDLREKLFSNSVPTSDSQRNKDLYKTYEEASKALDDANQAIQINSEDQLAMVNTAVSALAKGVRKLAELQLPGTMIKRELN
ncbi:hypothetical protein KEM56_002182 [Ascosphaera pollenicola]|nr:hypothetical protein KEM56_002182 [Ascosphaera pollenicola]